MTRHAPSLHERFEQQVTTTPDAPALTCSGQHLSYRELNERANRLAAYLRGHGVGPEVRVGLCLDRSLDTVIAILAVLKSGGAYVPMDPVYPAERVRLIVDDAACPLVLVHAAFAERFKGDGSSRVIVLDDSERPWETCPPENLPSLTTADSLAYVIYTSGSTGRPKGALVTHGNVYRLFPSMAPDFEFNAHDVWTMFHSYAFDFSVSELWGAFFFGGRVVVVPYLVSRSPEDFYQLLIDEQVTVLNQTPSAFKQIQLLDEAAPLERSQQLKLRYVLVGGEFMALPSLASWYKRHAEDAPRLVHVYGITETTVFVTYRPLTEADTAPGTPSLIGKVIEDLTIHVLDEGRQPVSVGDVGELFVGGAGVCRGYLNRPELTAERFISDPAGDGGTFYKTGDLVRLLDGDLEFIGRNDSQVQLRGYRVELGEIEAALAEHPSIGSAVVRMREDQPGAQRLVAYYIARAEADVTAFKAHLSETLPPYMIPSAFVPMDAFPLNNNGKVEVAALPAPPESTESKAVFVPPESEYEQFLAGVWESLLAVSPVGVEDDFFALGGHSLLVMQMVLRVQQAYAVSLPLRFVMEQPTLKAHADFVENAVRAGEALSPVEPIARAGETGPVALSFAQERLWIIDRLEPGNTTYNIPLFFTLRGAVDEVALRGALQAVVDRHDALRTVFKASDQGTVQHVLAEFPVSLASVPARSESAARDATCRASRQYMDLDSGPLVRFLFCAAEAELAYLGMVVHHAIFDGWSISVFLNDLACAYEALSSGETAALPALPVQYGDYSAWQRAGMASPAFQEHLRYWKEQLAEPLPILELPTDFPRPPMQTWEGAVVRRVLAAPEVRAVETFAQAVQKTPYAVLLTVWAALLHRYTGQSEMLVGSAVAGRNHPDLDGLIGFFVNTVVLRLKVDASKSFRSALGDADDVALDAKEHQDIPFERIVAETQHERDPSRSPLFQVLFVLHNTPVYEVRAGDVVVAGEELSNDGAKFDLTLSVQPNGEAFWLNLEYNTALFRADTAERMLWHYENLLRGALKAPDVPLSTLNILTEAERTLLLETWTDTAAPLVRSQSLVSLFESQAVSNPEVVAVADDETSLTYEALNAQANQLANYLLGQGVEREEPVPFFLSRTVRAVVAIVGILKSGAAFVPLDLMDPPGRRDRVLKVLRPRFILTESQLLSDLGDPGVPLKCLDGAGLLAGQPSEPPGIHPHGADLAYVIFTSGSTGDPKGVCCTHQGVVNLFQDLQARMPVGPGDQCSIWTALSFDVSVYESWTSLLAGATLHLIPERVRANPEQCLAWLRDRNVATGYIPGFMLPALLEAQQTNPVPLRRLLVGVEPLPESLLCEIVDATPGLLMLNLYGPTEAAIYVTLYEVPSQQSRPEGNAPIGKAIQNTRIYILDTDGNPVPVGVPGELYIGGVGLARGYYNDPELTERQFVPDPFTEMDTVRLYRTGDLVYFKPDGNIQFVRRMARYIKLRGYRVEPGEIEAVLRTYPEIDDAVVVLLGQDSSDQRLVAYVVTEEPEALRAESVHEYLVERLPGHMRPAQFVPMTAFPRTVQGKLDRAALPDPGGLTQSAGMEPPATEIESQLAALFAKKLGGEPVGVTSNFFDLGGHSLLAIQIVSEICRTYAVDLDLRTFFERPTVRALADRISRGFAPVALTESGQLLRLRGGNRTPFFCLKGAGDVGGSYETFAAALSPGQPFYGFPDLEFPELLAAEHTPTVEILAGRCIAEMRQVQPTGPYLLGGYSFGGIVAYEMARQLLEQGESVPLIAMLDSGVPGHYEAHRGGPFGKALNLLSRIRVRLLVFARCWKLLAGYVRDGVPILFQRLFRPGATPQNAPRLGDYIAWIQMDTSIQYYLIQAGLVQPRFAERRLEMIEEKLVLQSTRRMFDAQQSMKGYTFVPIPAEITLFRAEHNPWKTERYDPTRGWEKYAEKGVRVEVVPGNHMVLIRRPFATDLGRALQRVIDRIKVDLERM